MSHPTSVAGEAIVWLRNGSNATLQDVQKAVSMAGADVIKALDMPGTYLVRVRGANGTATDAEVAQSVSAMKGGSLFQYAGPNRLYYTLDTTPNDPDFSQQWGLPLMQVPKAWDVEKGETDVTLVVVDTGCDVTHEDLKARVSGTYNATDGSADVTDADGHGTHVCGIAAAATNNKLGVAGVTYQNVKLFSIKAVDSSGTFPESSLLNAMQHIRQKININGQHVVVNMSIGGDTTLPVDLTDPFHVAILAGANEGILFCISAGNSGRLGSPPSSPAYLASVSDMVLSIASVGPAGKVAYYSTQQAYNTVAAPGGDDSDGSFSPNMILSTLPGSKYGLDQGTSMASPAAAGVVALLLSAGADASKVKSVMETTATPAGTPVPNAAYGYGIVNAYAAVLAVTVDVTIISPQGMGGKNSPIGVEPQPVETKDPIVTVRVRDVVPSNVTISADGTVLASSDWTIQNITAYVLNPDGTISSTPLNYDAVLKDRIFAPGKHTISVTGVKDVRTSTDTLTFLVQPHTLPAGLALVSIPYYQATDDSGFALSSADILPYYLGAGTGFVLNRWVTETDGYKSFKSSADAADGFIPTGTAAPRQEGTAAPATGIPPAQFPLGVGFWCNTAPNGTGRAVVTSGRTDTSKSYLIPLVGRKRAGTDAIAWNMIGDPFPFQIAFNALMVDTTVGRLSIAQAASAGYVLPHLYSYDGTGYTYTNLPYGELVPWQGNWIGVTTDADMVLVVPPIGDPTRSRAALPSKATNAWTLRFGASVGGLRDANNVIGVSSNASDDYDANDVIKPPYPSPYVNAGILDTSFSRMAGLYAQDIRAAGGTKSWTIQVSTDKTNSDVTLNWSPAATLPRGLALLLKDNTTGQTVDMRSRSFVTFHVGDVATPRLYTITARQGASQGLRISNVSVLSGTSRAASAATIGFTLSTDASYNVQVLKATGSPIANVATRAAGGSGDVRLVWTGKDGAGRSVPAGAYLIQIRAVGPDGEVVRAMQPFMVVR